jgi:hypothetical protein
MNRYIRLVAFSAAASLLLSAQLAGAQSEPKITIVRPESSIAKPGDIGRRAHTNIELAVPTQAVPAVASGQVKSLALPENRAAVTPPNRKLLVPNGGRPKVESKAKNAEPGRQG